MEQVSGLYNPGFVGSQFHWWLGQVADSKLGVTINLIHHIIRRRYSGVGDTDIK